MATDPIGLNQHHGSEEFMNFASVFAAGTPSVFQWVARSALLRVPMDDPVCRWNTFGVPVVARSALLRVPMDDPVCRWNTFGVPVGRS
jgi:hypothetical protein